MTPHGLKRLLFAPAAILALFVSGCLIEQTPVDTPAEIELAETSADPRIEFLVKETNTKRELISLAYDPVSRDTGYILEPLISPQDKKRGLIGTGIGFKAKELDRLINLAKERKALAVEETKIAKTENGLLTKKGQTRWDSWYSIGDVKKLDEVRQIRVFIYKSGPPGLGSNWISAVRSGISNWNSQAKGTAVSFVETSSESDYDISFRGSYGIGSDGSMSSTAFIVGTETMSPDIALWVNTAFESNSSMPHNQKTTIAMSLLALSTNVTFTGMEGYYWNNGVSVHVPGTAYSDGDAYTPGSSILTQLTSSASTPVMTENDLKTFRSMYPVFGSLGISNGASRSLRMTGDHGITIDNGVKTFMVSTDTVAYLRTDGKVYRRVGPSGSNVQMWPGTGSSGTAENFLYDQGYWAVRTTQGRVYTRTPTGNWILQTGTQWIDNQDFRLDGNRLVVASSGRQYLRSYYLGSTSPSSPVVDWYNYHGDIMDWQVRNGLLVVAEVGDVWGKQGSGSWVFLHSSSNGYAERVMLSDSKIAMFYRLPGTYDYSVAVRHDGLYGWWIYYSDPVYNHTDIDLCGDKLAFLQENNYLRIIDYSTWLVHEHYTIPSGTDFRSVKLSGPNCDYVTGIIHHAGVMFAKYGVDLENRYLPFSTGTIMLRQGSTPE